MKQLTKISALFFSIALNAQIAVNDDMLNLVGLGELIMYSETAEQRDSANAAFFLLLKDIVADAEDPFSKDFSEVKNLSVMDSDDGNLRVFTWLVPGVPGSETFHGLMMQRKKKKDFKLIPLNDRADSLQNPEYRPLSASQWYGALYYQIFTVTDKKDTYHMLMGYRPIDENVQQKIIDVIHIDAYGMLQFGAKIFETPKLMDRVYHRPPYRLFLNYSAKVAASFRFRKQENKIVLDHLSPPDGTPVGQWQFYGPDFSYDGLAFENGKWVLKEDITIDSGIEQPLPSRAPRKDPATGKVRRE